MKKLFLIIALCLFSQVAHAENIVVMSLTPTISGAPVSGSALVTGSSPYYTDAIDVRSSTGYASLLVLTNASIDVAFEISEDGTNFYDPKDTSGNSLGAMASTLSANRWIVFSPRLANYMRFKLTINSNATVSLKFLQSSEY